MTAKEYLSQARALEREIEAKREHITRIRSTLARCTPHLTGMPGSGQGVDFTETAARIMDLTKETEEDIRRMIELKRAIGHTIDALEDPLERALLSYRYLSGLSWQQVALRLYCDRSTVWRIHKNALRKVRVPEKEIQS